MVVYRLLGPVDAVADGKPIDTGGGKQRELLALLILNAGRTIPVERIVDALWDEPPASAQKIIQNCVVRLRKLLPPDSLLTRGHAYELRLDGAQTDLAQFTSLVENADAASRRDEHLTAAGLLREALGLWRGPALAGIRTSRELRNEAERLDELRRSALGDRIDADLALGRHELVIPELRRMIAEQAFAERPQAQLMLALYRSGRQDEALRVYRSARTVLVEQLGVEPGPALKQLEQAILGQDPKLDAPEPSSDRRPSGSKLRARRVLIPVLLAAIVIAIVAAVFVLRPSGTAATAGSGLEYFDADSLGRLGKVSFPGVPIAVAASANALWVASAGDSSLTELDPRSAHPIPQPGSGTSSISVLEGTGSDPYALSSLVYASDSEWLADSTRGVLIRVNSYLGPLVRIPIGSPGDDLLAAGRRVIWVAHGSPPGELVAVDESTDRVLERIATSAVPIAVAATGASVWVVSAGPLGSGRLTRYAAATGRVRTTTNLPGHPTALALGFGSVWVTVSSPSLVLRVDMSSDAVAATIPVGTGPDAITAGPRAVWVTSAGTETFTAIDPATDHVRATGKLRGLPHAVLAAFDKLWIVES